MKIVAIVGFLLSSSLSTVFAAVASSANKVGSGKRQGDSVVGNKGSQTNLVKSIQVFLDAGVQPDMLNDDEMGFFQDALMFTFDETHLDGKAIFAFLDHVTEDPDVVEQRGVGDGNTGRLTSFPSWYYWYIAIGCGIFCRDDDDYSFTSNEVARSGVLGSKQTLDAWADSLCGALRDSWYEVFDNAQGCMIVVDNEIHSNRMAEEQAFQEADTDKVVTEQDYLDNRMEDKISGQTNLVEAIQVHLETGVEPNMLNDEEIGFFQDALMFTFDETHPNGEVIFAFLDHVAEDPDATQQKGVSGSNGPSLRSYPSWYYWYIAIGCGIFCHDDDYSFASNEVVRSGVLGSKKTLEAWADNLCGALRDSSYEVFENAEGCVIVVESKTHAGVDDIE